MLQIYNFNMQKDQKKKEYKISYARCKKGGLHKEQPLNIVCLDETCHQHRLICSICKTQQHAKHQTQPLKYYIDGLSTSFSEDKGDVKEKLNSMQESKNEILVTLQQTVTNISEKFKALEIQILKRYKVARERILQQDAMKKGFQGIYQILSTPNHPDLIPMVSKYTKRPPPAVFPVVDRLLTLQSAIMQQIDSAINFYADQKAKPEITLSTKVLCPTGIVFDGQVIEQIVGNKLNLCLLNQPITTQNHKVKIRILSDNIKIAMGIITMSQFKKYDYLFDPNKAKSNFICWISSDGKGTNYNSNSITGFAKEDVFDMTLKKGQLVINKRKGKQFASLLAKDLGVDWYFFWAILGPGKIQIVDKKNKK